MRLGSLFSGTGGLDAAVEQVLGTTTAWVSDIDKGACTLLAHRYPDVPNLGDITTVDWSQVEPVDVLTGGFPCQDVSHAGKRAGLHAGTRTGLWSHMAAAIEQLRPRLVVAENVRGLLSASATSDLEPCPWCVGDDVRGALRALGAVLGTLADIGYDASWYGLRAADVGACHGRFRVFVVAADTDQQRRRPLRPEPTGQQRTDEPDRHGSVPAPDADVVGHERGGTAPRRQRDRPLPDPATRHVDPRLDRRRHLRQQSRRRQVRRLQAVHRGDVTGRVVPGEAAPQQLPMAGRRR